MILRNQTECGPCCLNHTIKDLQLCSFSNTYTIGLYYLVHQKLATVFNSLIVRGILAVRLLTIVYPSLYCSNVQRVYIKVEVGCLCINRRKCDREIVTMVARIAHLIAVPSVQPHCFISKFGTRLSERDSHLAGGTGQRHPSLQLCQYFLF